MVRRAGAGVSDVRWPAPCGRDHKCGLRRTSKHCYLIVSNRGAVDLSGNDRNARVILASGRCVDHLSEFTGCGRQWPSGVGCGGQRSGARPIVRGVIIVVGWLRVHPDQRAGYLESCRGVVEAARRADGCVDFSICADLIDDGRITILEQWTSAAAVEQFRGDGTPDDQQALILDAHVEQHTVGESIPLT